MKLKLLLQLAVAGGMAFAALPAVAAPMVIDVGTFSPNAYFFLTGNSTPYTSSITSTFGATATGAFDDSFEFTIPQQGVGSGNISTSFSAAANQLTIQQLLINGTSYVVNSSAGGQSFEVAGLSIQDGVKNTIEVIGTTAANATGSFSGNATFAAVSAAPEPGTWLLMIAGIGMIGTVLRRRPTAVSFA